MEPKTASPVSPYDPIATDTIGMRRSRTWPRQSEPGVDRVRSRRRERAGQLHDGQHDGIGDFSIRSFPETCLRENECRRGLYLSEDSC